MVAHPVGAGMKEDPGQFPVPKAVVEAFEPLEFLDDLVRHPPPAADRYDLERRREQAQHALCLKTTLEGADRFGVGVGFLGPLAGGTLLQQDQWADEFIALLHHVVEGQLGVVNVCTSHHSGGLPAAAPGEHVLRPPGQAAHHALPCCEARLPQRRRAGRHENDRGCEGAYCSEAGDRPRARPTWGANSSRPHRGA